MTFYCKFFKTILSHNQKKFFLYSQYTEKKGLNFQKGNAYGGFQLFRLNVP